MKKMLAILRFRRPAFTIIELLVAAAVLGILASLVVVNYSAARRGARDSRRKADVQTIANAVSQYGSVKGTFFISDGTCSVDVITSDTENRKAASTGSGCVGADGLSFGKVNAKSGQTDGFGKDNSGYGKRVYSRSIADVLYNGQFLSSKPADPSALGNGDAADTDYVLIRACRSGSSAGHQAFLKNGNIFAVWAKLESAPSQAEIAQSLRYPGSSSSVQELDYLFDFGAYNSDLLNYTPSKGYAVGNGVRSADLTGSCSGTNQNS